MEFAERTSMLAAAEALYRAGNVPGALERVRQVLASAPQDIHALVLSAAYATDLGQTKDAIRDGKAALALNPHPVRALRTLAYAEASRAHFGAARSYLDEALKLAPADAPAHLVYASICTKQRLFNEAASHAASALEHAPDDPNVLATYAIAMVNVHEIDKADDAAQRAYRAGPESISALHARGLVALIQGRSEEAAEFAQLAIAKSPTNPAVLDLVAKVNLNRNPLFYIPWLLSRFIHRTGRVGFSIAYASAWAILLFGAAQKNTVVHWSLVGAGLVSIVVLLLAPRAMRFSVYLFVRRNRRAVRVGRTF